MEFWLDEIKDYADGDPEILLLGNKSDLYNLKEIDLEEVKVYLLNFFRGRNFFQKASHMYDLTFFEVSAKENKNILEAFLCFSEKLCEKK